MKMPNKRIIVVLSLVLALAGLAAAAASRDGECFTVLVGRKASADGSVIVAHNEDDRGEIIVNLRKIQARAYGASRKVDLGHGAFYETDGHTNGFLWIEATTQEFADSFINDRGVLITSDSCPSRVTEEDYTDGGIGWMLRRLMAEKAASAREAVRIAGGLIEKYGYRSSGRTYSIADKNEAWMLAVLRGRHWYAERVPDDGVAVIPNHFSIRAIRPGDPDHFMGSPDIVEYAAKNGWYDAAKDGAFDFKEAFERPSNRELAADGNALRHWRGLSLLTGRTWELGRDYPFSVKPGRKVTAEALIAILRDHYEGTEYDATDGYKTGTPNRTKFRTICTSSTINAFIVSLGAKRPEPLSASIWLAMGKPDTTLFLPLYYGIGSLPPGAGLGPNTHDDAVFYKQHFEDAEIKAAKGELLNTKVLELEKAAEADYGPMHATLVKELFPAETEFIDGRPKFEKDFAGLYAKDKEAALKKLDDYVAAAFAKVSDLTTKLLAEIPKQN
ncbi:MAG: C69 family dipeptidase [Candidatus Aminicenantales bacterium]